MKQVSCARCQPNTPFFNGKTNVVRKKEGRKKRYQVVIVVGSHLFPFRTEKLSPLTPMVLQCNAGEQEAAFFIEKRSPEDRNIHGAFFYVYFLCDIYILLSIQIEIRLSTFFTIFICLNFCLHIKLFVLVCLRKC